MIPLPAPLVTQPQRSDRYPVLPADLIAGEGERICGARPLCAALRVNVIGTQREYLFRGGIRPHSRQADQVAMPTKGRRHLIGMSTMRPSALEGSRIDRMRAALAAPRQVGHRLRLTTLDCQHPLRRRRPQDQSHFLRQSP